MFNAVSFIKNVHSIRETRVNERFDRFILIEKPLCYYLLQFSRLCPVDNATTNPIHLSYKADKKAHRGQSDGELLSRFTLRRATHCRTLTKAVEKCCPAAQIDSLVISTGKDR